MDWGTLPDWLSAASNLGVAVAAGVAAWQGAKSLSTWREETLGRRRIELAEEVLADFYEACDIFGWVRSPFALSAESESRPGRGDEPEQLRGLRDAFHVPLKRLTDHAEFFAKLSARRYRVIAAFGLEAAKVYDEVRAIHSRIAAAAHMLIKTATDERASDLKKSRNERYEAIIWEGFDERNEVKERLDQLVQVVETRFRREIDGSLRQVRRT